MLLIDPQLGKIHLIQFGNDNEMETSSGGFFNKQQNTNVGNKTKDKSLNDSNTTTAAPAAAQILHHRDFCLQGSMSGQTFNRMMILGYALWYSSCLSSWPPTSNHNSSCLLSGPPSSNQDKNYNNSKNQCQPAPPTKFHSVVRLDQNWMEFYNKWFEPDSIKVLPLHDEKMGQKNQSAINCGTIHPLGNIFHRQVSDTDRDLQDSCPKPKHYLSGVHLLPSLKHEYLEAAQRVLHDYKQKHGQKQQRKEARLDPIVVTVHQRWLEGSCPLRASHPLQSNCPGIKQRLEQLDAGAAMPETLWGFTCFYNETLVRQQIPEHVLQGRSALDKNQVIVLLLGDGQRDDSPEVKTFMHIDRNPFPIQIGMMLSSEYHFGNPMSTVDHTMAIWRARLGLKQYPESCYAIVWRQSQEDRERQEKET
ncbi:hypothetical protein ACA910_006247 [Epithemia clementina (nom. ined.)]